MSEPISLSEVPGKLLNRRKWNALRKFASKELIALSYINPPTLMKRIQVASFGTGVVRALKQSIATGLAGPYWESADPS